MSDDYKQIFLQNAVLKMSVLSTVSGTVNVKLRLSKDFRVGTMKMGTLLMYRIQ